MRPMFEKKFELRYFEMSRHGEASPATILTLLEEAASDHCCAIDHSLYDLIKKDVGWVLLSGVMKMERYPRHKEKITIRTWLSAYTSIKGIRENIIYDEQGNIIGRAKGLWVFFDIKRRRPVQIFDEIKERWSSHEEISLDHDIVQKIKTPDTSQYMKEFSVHRFDIDMNRHVNNIKYLQWVMESIPDEIMDNYYLHTIDGRFITEAQYGDKVRSFTEKEGYPYSFVHNIKVETNDRVCAAAKTVWKKR